MTYLSINSSASCSNPVPAGRDTHFSDLYSKLKQIPKVDYAGIYRDGPAHAVTIIGGAPVTKIVTTAASNNATSLAAPMGEPGNSTMVPIVSAEPVAISNAKPGSKMYLRCVLVPAEPGSTNGEAMDVDEAPKPATIVQEVPMPMDVTAKTIDSGHPVIQPQQ
jgi:hypothetical protein